MIGSFLSAGPNPQLPMCVHYSSASEDCKIAGKGLILKPVQFVCRAREPIFPSARFVRDDALSSCRFMWASPLPCLLRHARRVPQVLVLV